LRPAQPARRQAAISAPPAPDLDLPEPLAGASGAGGISPMVCRQRAAAGSLIYLLLATPHLISSRPYRTGMAQSVLTRENGHGGGGTAQGRSDRIRARLCGAHDGHR